MKMSSPTFNALRFFSTKKKKKSILIFSSHIVCPQPNVLDHSHTRRHPSEREMMWRNPTAIRDGAGDTRDGAFLTDGASWLPLVATSHCLYLGAQLRAPTAFMVALV